MSGIVEALLKFFSEFTWRKLFSLIIVLVCTIGILSLYERYTASFQISRLQRATELLLSVQELESRQIAPNSELDRARRALVAQTVEAVEKKPLTLDFVPATMHFSMDNLWCFMAGSAMWIVFALFQLPKIKEKKERDAFLGILLVAGLSGFFAVFVPPIWWPWFHLFIYPFLLIATIATASVPIVYFIKKRPIKNNVKRDAP